MTQKHIGWLHSFDTRHFPLEEILRREGHKVHSHSHGIPAIRSFVSHPYDLIILDLKAPPGRRDVEFKDKHPLDDLINIDPLISTVMHGSNGTVEYWRLGLHFLQTITVVGPNQDTPIYVFSPYKAVRDSNFRKARKTSINAGATDYFDANNTQAYARLLETVRDKLRG